MVAEAQHNPTASAVADSDSIAVRHLLVGAAFLLLAGFLTLMQYLKGTFPAFLDGFGFWSYGRLKPMATSITIFGWLTPTLIGAAYYLIPRLSGEPLRYPRLAGQNLWLLAAAVIAGTGSVGLGLGDGFELFEFPVWADLILLVALAVPAVVVTRSIRAYSGDSPAALLYVIAAVIWLPAIAAVSNLPGLDPVGQSLLAAFTTAAIHYLWIIGGTVGLVFYLAPKLTGAFLANEQLARIGFWTLALAGGASGYSRFTHGPGPEWLETAAIVLALLLVVFAITVFVNVTSSVRGYRNEIRSSVALQFALVGALLIPLPILLSAVAGFRSVAAIVGLTAWWEGTSFFILFGIGGWITAGFVYAALPHLLGRDVFSSGLAKRHLKLTLVGVILTSASLWMSGLVSGFTWVGGTYGGSYVNTGEGFTQTLDAVSFFGVLALIGALITFSGQLVHGYLVYRTVTSGAATAQEVLVPVEVDGE